MTHRRERLIQLRKAQGYSQREVALKLKESQGIDITTSYYGMIEQGSRTPRLAHGLAIAKLLGADIEDIFFNHEDNKTLSNKQEAI